MDEMGIRIGHVAIVSGALVSGVIDEERASSPVQFGGLVRVRPLVRQSSG